MIKTQLMSMVASAVIGCNFTTGVGIPYTIDYSIVNNQQPKQEIITQVTQEQKDNFKSITIKDIIDETNKRIIAEANKRKEEIERIKKSNDRKQSVQFDSSNVLIKSNIEKQELNKVFDKIGQPQMKSITNACVDAEKEYGVNALFLAGIVAQESLWTKKAAGDGTNLTGYCVYTNTSKGETFHSYYSNIMATAKLLRHDYLSPKGRYFHGYSTESINTEYCKEQDQITTKWSWHRAINKISNNFESVYHSNVKHLEEVPNI